MPLWEHALVSRYLRSPKSVSNLKLETRTSQKEIPFSKCHNGHWRGGKLSHLSYGIYLQETCFPVVFIESMHKCFFYNNIFWKHNITIMASAWLITICSLMMRLTQKYNSNAFSTFKPFSRNLQVSEWEDIRI